MTLPVDTGSSHTVISLDILESIGVNYGIGGSVTLYTKTMENLKTDKFTKEKIEVNVDILPGENSALLGLNILKQFNFIIDLGELKLHLPTQHKGDLD